MIHGSRIKIWNSLSCHQSFLSPSPSNDPFLPLSLPPSISYTLSSINLPWSLSVSNPPYLSSSLSLTKVVHQFSHILHHYHVWHITCTVKQKLKVTPAGNEPTRWVTHKELMQSAISTAVKKVPIMTTRCLDWWSFMASFPGSFNCGMGAWEWSWVHYTLL